MINNLNKPKSFLLPLAMEVEEMYAEEEKIKVKDNTVSQNLNNSNVITVQFICDIM